MTEDNTEQARFVGLTVDLVSAYVSNNPLPIADITGLIASTYAAVVGLSKGTASGEVVAEAARPSANVIKRSITPEGLISFIDGKTYKTLKRHLTGHGLNPDQYRTKYGLPRDYPMVSENYSAQRSALAKAIGLGQGGKSEAEVAAPAPEKTVPAAVKSSPRKASETKASNAKDAAEPKSAPRKKAA